MVERLNAHPVAIQIPIGSEDTFQGLIDLIKMKAVIYEEDYTKEPESVEIPAEYKEKLKNIVRKCLILLQKQMMN